VPGKPLVGIHRPPNFLMQMVSMNLWNEMQRREEEWKREKRRLKVEIQKKDEEIKEKDVEIAILKERIDGMAALVPQVLECRTPPRVRWFFF